MAKVDSEQRICFGLEWYDDPAEAGSRAKEVRNQGREYNGGMLHGKPCGRERHFDREVDGVKWYAVSS